MPKMGASGAAWRSPAMIWGNSVCTVASPAATQARLIELPVRQLSTLLAPMSMVM